MTCQYVRKIGGALGLLATLLILTTLAALSAAGPSHSGRNASSDTETLKSKSVHDNSSQEITEAWQVFLDELGKLARPADAAAAAGAVLQQHEDHLGLSSQISLDDVGLMMAEDLVRRMSRHWQHQHQQKGGQQGDEQAQEQEPGQPGSGAELRTKAGTAAAGTAVGSSAVFRAANSTGSDRRAEAAAPTDTAAAGKAGPDSHPTPAAKGADAGTNDEGSEASKIGSASGPASDYAAAGGARRGRVLLQGAAGGATGNRMYANAFRLVFGNFFDFVEGARRFIATLAAEAQLLLINVDWIRDLAFLATAPLDNVINSNWLPLPQSIDDLRTLLETAVNDYCTSESLTTSQLVLGSYDGPTFSLELLPSSCPIKVDTKTGRRSIDWDRCTAARLRITITPATYTGKHYSASSYTGKSCKYSRAFGTDKTYNLGGASNSFTFRRSARQLDINPVLNQFFLRGQFSPFVADNLNFGNITGGPILEVDSISAPTNADGTNTAVLLRSPAEAAASEAVLRNQLIAVQDDAPVQYSAPRRSSYLSVPPSLPRGAAAPEEEEPRPPPTPQPRPQPQPYRPSRELSRKQLGPQTAAAAAAERPADAGMDGTEEQPLTSFRFPQAADAPAEPWPQKVASASDTASAEVMANSKQRPTRAPSDTQRDLTPPPPVAGTAASEVERQPVVPYNVESLPVAGDHGALPKGPQQDQVGGVAAATTGRNLARQPSAKLPAAGSSTATATEDGGGGGIGNGSAGAVEATSHSAGTVQGRDQGQLQAPAADAPASAVTYTEWLLRVVDEAFGTDG